MRIRFIFKEYYDDKLYQLHALTSKLIPFDNPIIDTRYVNYCICKVKMNLH